MKIKDDIQGVTPKADAEAVKSCEANKKEFDKVFKSRMVKSSGKKEEVNTKLELDESMFSEAKVDYKSFIKEIVPSKYVLSSIKPVYGFDSTQYLETHLEPNDDVINDIILELENKGFKLIDSINPVDNGNEGRVTYAGNYAGNRILATIVYGPGYVTFKAGYVEEDDKELFGSKSLKEAKTDKAYKMKKVEDLDKDVYTYVYDCLFDGTHNYIPVNAVREKRFDVDRYVETPNKHHIGVKYEDESEADKVIKVADDLFLPFKRDDRAKTVTILLNSKTSSMPLEQFIDEMELDKDEIGYEMVATRNKKSLKESRNNEYYSDVARHFDHSIASETAEVISDLVDRAMSNIEDDYDIDEAVMDALDNGLIYHKDLWAIKQHYEGSELAEGTFESLFNDVYSIVSDIADKDNVDEGLTSAERHNRNMDRIFQDKKDRDARMSKFLKDNSDITDDELKKVQDDDKVGLELKNRGLHNRYWDEIEGKK